jgi:hypothetical protein
MRGSSSGACRQDRVAAHPLGVAAHGRKKEREPVGAAVSRALFSSGLPRAESRGLSERASDEAVQRRQRVEGLDIFLQQEDVIRRHTIRQHA